MYVQFAREGPQKPADAAKSLSLKEHTITRILENLEEKEIVKKIREKDPVFSALPLEKAIDLLVKWHLEETRSLEQNRREILLQWKALIKKNYAK